MLPPLEADGHGNHGSAVVTAGAFPELYLTGWHAQAWVSYRFKTPSAQRWTITAEVRAPQAVSLTLVQGETKVPVSIPATDSTSWTKVTLGSLDLPAGATSFELKPVEEGWNRIELRDVVFTHE